MKKHYWILHYIGQTKQYTTNVATTRKYINLKIIGDNYLHPEGDGILVSVSYLGKMTDEEFNEGMTNENTDD